MQLTPLALTAFPEQLRRNVEPGAPGPLKLMAARGLVPAAPPELAMVLYQLSLDPDAAVASAARRTMADAPDAIARGAAAAPLDPRVLDFIAASQPRNEKLLEAVLSNRQADDETFVRLAATCSESLSELIASNEVRLLRRPAIIEALYLNANARMSTIDRLIDLAKRQGVKFSMVALQSILDDPGYDTTAAAVESVGRELNSDADDLFRSLLAESLEGDHHDPEEDDETKLEQPRRRTVNEDDSVAKKSIATAILSMTISEKMRLATLGSKAEREFLIKENNRLIHMAAVTSPKVQLRDIQTWSGSRVMPDGVLTYIANHRRYRRVYVIVVNLVNNPKTPVKEALRLFPSLVDKDLKALVKNRNISYQLRRQAKALQDSRDRKTRK
ncbi:MAG: hypothetical protein H6700_01800 [Myxococcales bacterium]|nr:hypothetical protein [Myxococcales bacterium]